MASFQPFESVEAETLLSGRSDWIDPEGVRLLSQYPLECVETEFPHFIGSIDAPEEF